MLSWAASKFEVETAVDNRTSAPGGTGEEVEDGDVVAEQFASIGDLMDAAQPTDGPERALVVAFWFQEIEGRDGWGAGTSTTRSRTSDIRLRT